MSDKCAPQDLVPTLIQIRQRCVLLRVVAAPCRGLAVQKLVDKPSIKLAPSRSPNSGSGLSHRKDTAGRNDRPHVPIISAPEKKGGKAQRIESQSAQVPFLGVTFGKPLELADLFRALKQDLMDTDIH